MSTAARHFVLATAGHVDHGKSMLVQALTGTDPDRLPEEKRRGMTIELGFAQFLLPTPSGPPLRIDLVDVPGHEDFVKNMVAGVGAVDGALLVIAADDGPMPQTLEHLQILTYLGIRRGVVALTKTDVASDVAPITDVIRNFVRGSSLENAPIVPVSAKTGRGIDELRNALVAALSTARSPPDDGKSRVAIDRAFTVRGAGTVVTGTLIGGSLTRGQEAILQPSGIRTRVRGLQSHGISIDRAEPGSRVAVNLSDVHPRTDTATGTLVGRGDWLTSTAAPPPCLILDAAISTAFRSTSPQEVVLRDGLTVKLHLGTAAVTARLQWEGTARRFARLRLTRPVLAMIGDRFVLRAVSDQRTLAGGVVLDAVETVRHRTSFTRDTAQHVLLAARAASPSDPITSIQSALARDRVVDHQSLFARSPIADSTLEAICRELSARNQIRQADGNLIRAEAWEQARNGVLEAVRAYHRTHPQQQGLPIHDVRRLVQQSLGLRRGGKNVEAIGEAIIASFAADEIVRTGTVLRRTSHHPVLPPHLQAAGRIILDVLLERPFDPPSSKELIRNDAGHQALKYLITTGQVIDLGQHTILSAEAYSAAVTKIRDQLRVTRSATVSELKAALGSSRRVMVPLLERLDRDHITRRQGDLRLLA